MPTETPGQTTIEDKLEEILVHMRTMDRRDRLRLWGGFFRSLISFGSLVLFLWSGWYFIQHGPELMKQIADTAASSAAAYTKNQGQSVVDQMMNQYAIPR